MIIKAIILNVLVPSTKYYFTSNKNILIIDNSTNFETKKDYLIFKWPWEWQKSYPNSLALIPVTTSLVGGDGRFENEGKTGDWSHSEPWKKEGLSAQFEDFDSFS